eukprot:RCo049461
MEVQLEQWYWNIPVVTRVYLTLACLTSAAVHFEFVTLFHLYLNFHLVWSKFEIWRLFTTFLFFDMISIHLFFYMHFLYSYCRRLEEHYYHRRTADFLFMLLFGASLMLVFSAWVYNMKFLSHSLMIMVVYLWSRRNPDEHLNLLGLFTISAPYLAYVLLGFTILLGGRLENTIPDVVGIAVGHLYWFLADIFPAVTGKQVLRTPGFVAALFPNDDDFVRNQAQQEWRPFFG